MRQVLINLLDNAIDHGKGEITLRACAAADGVEISVSDQGGGFPRDFAERTFDRFSRADSTRGESGAGLGLALVRAIAVAHGGRVWISSKALTAVHLWLPQPHSGLISAS